MVSILEIIQQGKRDLLIGEIAMTQRMLAAYELVWLEVERQLLRLDTNLAAAGPLDSGAVDAWLRQQDWYTQLLRSIEAEFTRFNTDAATVLGRTQAEAVGTSRLASDRVRRWIGDRAGFVADVRPQVFERWVSATLPDSPLRASIERHGVEAAKVIERRMTEGIGSGKGVRSIVNGIRAELGPESPKPYELATLVRTETNRAYRGSFRDDMEAMGPDVISGWEWLAAHSLRTCPACLAMDGRVFPYDQYPDTQHVNCRCIVRPRVNENLIPGANPPRKLGSEYFADLPEKDQRRILRTQGRLDAYKDGVPLSEMVGVRANATWGPSVYIKPVRDLKEARP
ncbi:MAG: minor capsid protein [Thermomicrobiales bacterium]